MNFLPEKSYGQHGSTKKLVLQLPFKAMTGIQGVSSSEWFPIIQVQSGNVEVGVTAST